MIHMFIYTFFTEKIRFDISCEMSALQIIRMKYQALFSLKNEKKLICFRMPATILNGTLRVKVFLVHPPVPQGVGEQCLHCFAKACLV